MAEINHTEFRKFLEGVSEETLPPVILIHGEEYLFKSAFSDLLDRVVPPSRRSLHYEPVDEDSESIYEVIERLNTFSLMPGLKVVSLTESRIFHSGKESSAILETVKTAFDKDDKKKAAKHLASLLSASGLSYEEVRTESGKEAIRYYESFSDDGTWLDALSEFCVNSGIAIPQSSDNARILSQAILQGFPDHHHLIITAELVDKRKALYDTIKNHGIVIDCTVPKGDRKSDKEQQTAILRKNAEIILSGSGKQLTPDGFSALTGMTGFDIRMFAANLEKLVNFVGDRATITGTDVATLISRSKQDPIYELSGAISERNLENALFYTQTLLKNSVYPLQILATIVNQVRRLVLAKSFLESLPAGIWSSGMDYNTFRTRVMPAVVDFDARIKKRIDDRTALFDASEAEGKKKKKKKKVTTDLLLAKNPKSPYPVFLLIKNASRYSLDELYTAYDLLWAADTRLKSTGEDPRLVIDETIIRICRPRSKASPR